MNDYLKIAGGIILLLFGCYTIFTEIQRSAGNNHPISTPKIIFSGISSIVLGIILIYEVIWG
jgi:small neutral amino acid transporter SnatA (MarC family)